MAATVQAQSGEKRRSARVRPAGLVSKTATVFADQKGATVIDCHVIDLSTGGAALEARGDAAIPGKLVMVHGGVKKRARVIWRKGRRFGVAF